MLKMPNRHSLLPPVILFIQATHYDNWSFFRENKTKSVVFCYVTMLKLLLNCFGVLFLKAAAGKQTIFPHLFICMVHQVEYDLKNSHKDKLLLLRSERIEQSAVPQCIVWHPPLNAEELLLVASDQYKMKLFNSKTLTCRSVILWKNCDFLQIA